MDIEGVIWFEDVIDKLISKHNVTTDEVEQILADNPQIKFVETGHYQGEDVYAAYGQTDSGRYLVVFFIYKLNHEAIILSARDMDRKERKKYGKR